MFFLLLVAAVFRKIGTPPGLIFPFRCLPLGRLSIIISKASTIWLRNSSGPIMGFTLNRCRNIELEQMLSVPFS